MHTLSRRQFVRLVSFTGATAVLSACAPKVGAPADGANPAAAANVAPTVMPTPDPKAGWPEVFRAGYFGGDDPDEVIEGNEPLRLLLEEALEIPVEVFTGTSYSAVIEAMRNKKVESMQVGPFSYILARQEAGAEALAVGISTRADPPVYDPTLVPYYYSCISTKKGSGINSIEDLKGRSLNFVDPASTSGHLIPRSLLVKHGIDPDKDLTTVFAGSHPTSVLSVWNDKAEACASTFNTLANLAQEGQIRFCGFPDGQTNKARTPEELKEVFDACPEGNIVIIGLSDPIPSTPFAIRGDLPQSLKDAVKRVLLSTKDNAEYIAVKKSWFVDPAPELGLAHLDNLYDGLRDVAKLLDLDLSKME